jgi:hypothetical protein
VLASAAFRRCSPTRLHLTTCKLTVIGTGRRARPFESAKSKMATVVFPFQLEALLLLLLTGMMKLVEWW